ncbi:hypothetical protein KMZ30_19135 [Phycicoccus sp. KQZ13P-1]|uniref:hypothetical protein n=1 Tax=Phycicoccus mangrovi TaxID=2840470 RepID=UPI001C00866F|nr:hypothetical protein [Phycicoccus mangrovi]MBT9257693.1 hypothetical protein [Phycicoccus mangrovi]
MTTLQLSLALGLVVGLGVAGIAYALVPAQPDLGDVLARLSPPARRRPGAPTASVNPDLEERLGLWAERTLPTRLLGVPPARDLAVVRKTPAQFYGKKVLYGLLGMVLPTAVTGFFALIGLRIPFVVPVGATLLLSAVLFMTPSRDIGQEAKRARTESARALSAFIELCALERNSGAGTVVSLSNAAEVGDSWIFRRISEELARSRYNGQPPWDCLEQLSEDHGLPELAEIADTMRLANDEGSQVYRQLRARSASVRSALLSAELAEAGQVEERMYLPGSLLGVIFLALLMAPPLLRLLSAS